MVFLNFLLSHCGILEGFLAIFINSRVVKIGKFLHQISVISGHLGFSDVSVRVHGKLRFDVIPSSIFQGKLNAALAYTVHFIKV